MPTPEPTLRAVTADDVALGGEAVRASALRILASQRNTGVPLQYVNRGVAFGCQAELIRPALESLSTYAHDRQGTWPDGTPVATIDDLGYQAAVNENIYNTVDRAGRTRSDSLSQTWLTCRASRTWVSADSIIDRAAIVFGPVRPVVRQLIDQWDAALTEHARTLYVAGSPQWFPPDGWYEDVHPGQVNLSAYPHMGCCPHRDTRCLPSERPGYNMNPEQPPGDLENPGVVDGFRVVNQYDYDKCMEAGWAHMSESRKSYTWEEELARVTYAIKLSQDRGVAPLVHEGSPFPPRIRHANPNCLRGVGLSILFRPDIVAAVNQHFDSLVTVREYTGLSGQTLAKASRDARKAAAQRKIPQVFVTRPVGVDKRTGRRTYAQDYGYPQDFLDTLHLGQEANQPAKTEGTERVSSHV